MIRKISAVIAGYLVFAVSAGIWFPLMGYKPHAPAPAAFMLETLAYGVCFSLLAGFVTKAIGKSFFLNYVLAAIIFLGAVLSLLFSDGSHWTQLTTLLVFAPCALLGGVIRFSGNAKQ
ncbi:hypothetical protein ACCC92_02935 [Mucilaginibacter sp. Mucisp84]|uniref:hypothetical protein n=1 Tax=Mucilaginibacter sp. Mucisp84 TaxID=3243058 RepID=UPI0039A42229